MLCGPFAPCTVYTVSVAALTHRIYRTWNKGPHSSHCSLTKWLTLGFVCTIVLKRKMLFRSNELYYSIVSVYLQYMCVLHQPKFTALKCSVNNKGTEITEPQVLLVWSFSTSINVNAFCLHFLCLSALRKRNNMLVMFLFHFVFIFFPIVFDLYVFHPLSDWPVSTNSWWSWQLLFLLTCF